MPVMVGVRDIVGTLSRISPSTSRVFPMEADMDDMFWKSEIFPAIKSVLHALKEQARGKREIWFSLHRNGGRCLDRIGKASSKDFRTLSKDEVLSYVEWDINENTLFAVDSVILQQGRQGVPIGGHISAQLCRDMGYGQGAERTFYRGETRHMSRVAGCHERRPYTGGHELGPALRH